MKRSQLHFLASALVMTAGLYILSGPLHEDRAGFGRLIPVWGVGVLYEASLIGMAVLLQRQGREAGLLKLLALFFLADPVFMADGFASTDPLRGGAFNGLLFGVAVGLAWLLARVHGAKAGRGRRILGVAALAFIHLGPSWVVCDWGTVSARIQGAAWAAVPVAAGLLAFGRWGAAGWLALVLHAGASAGVANVPFEVEWFCPLFVSLSPTLPWPRLGWIPILPALLVSPARHQVIEVLFTKDGLGVGLVLGAFALLGAGGMAARGDSSTLPGDGKSPHPKS